MSFNWKENIIQKSKEDNAKLTTDKINSSS